MTGNRRNPGVCLDEPVKGEDGVVELGSVVTVKLNKVETQFPSLSSA
ncbi:MAG: hypothetical protein ACFE95_13725 [Candidatus Hodarchaeota archaeon]